LLDDLGPQKFIPTSQKTTLFWFSKKAYLSCILMAETFPVTKRDYAVDWEAEPPRQLPVEAAYTSSQTTSLFCYKPTKFDWQAYHFNHQILYYLRHSLAEAIWELFLSLVRYVCFAAHRWSPDSTDHPPPLTVPLEKSNELHMIAPPFGPPNALLSNPLHVSGPKEMVEKWLITMQQTALQLQAWIAMAKQRSKELGLLCTWRWPGEPFAPFPYAFRPDWMLHKQEDPESWSIKDIWGLTAPVTTLRRPPLISAIAERAVELLEEAEREEEAAERESGAPAPPPYSPSHFSTPHEFHPPTSSGRSYSPEDDSLFSSITEHSTGGGLEDCATQEDQESSRRSRIIENVVRAIVLNGDDMEEVD
jgi:hypothetical protein